jgi:hypothetical protein
MNGFYENERTLTGSSGRGGPDTTGPHPEETKTKPASNRALQNENRTELTPLPSPRARAFSRQRSRGA